MDIVETWTGRTARALQAALRETNEGFAERLGVAVRTVAAWHAQPDIVPRPEIQQALDTVHEQAAPSARRRFAVLARPADAAQPQALRVAVTVVVRGEDVLLVCRRGDGAIGWQFPAGVVKPGGSAEAVAVQETHAETGVHCAVREHLGSRVHPVTGVACDYLLADWLAGEPVNADPIENLDVAWAPVRSLTRFIPADRIFPPVLTALEAA